MTLVRAKFIDCDCQDCLSSRLDESRTLGGLPLGGPVVEIPEHWLNANCPHGRRGLQFIELKDNSALSIDNEAPERIWEIGIEVGSQDSQVDATKNVGYPVRENGPYGSHPMHDPYDDESGPDGLGSY